MIDKSKQYKTRDGREVRIYAVDGGGDENVHGAYLSTEGWVLTCWYANGKWTDANGKWTDEGEDKWDLIEVKPRIKREVWVNVYPGGVSGHSERVIADSLAIGTRIACVRLTIDCEEGEGL